VYAVAHRTPGLAERFLLVDDDVFFTAPTEPSAWFPEVFAVFAVSRSPHPVEPPGVIVVPHLRLPEPVYPLAAREGPVLAAARARGVALPERKWQGYSHQPQPLRVSFVRAFERAYPGYNAFVESHVERYETTSEEMGMIYYEFFHEFFRRSDALPAESVGKRGAGAEGARAGGELPRVDPSPRSPPAGGADSGPTRGVSGGARIVNRPFYARPCFFWHFLNQAFPSIPFNTALFRVAGAACGAGWISGGGFAYANFQDEFSVDPDVYAREARQFRRLMRRMFPETPWFEAGEGAPSGPDGSGPDGSGPYDEGCGDFCLEALADSVAETLWALALTALAGGGSVWTATVAARASLRTWADVAARLRRRRRRLKPHPV
jgi:hypothetical protein